MRLPIVWVVAWAAFLSPAFADPDPCNLTPVAGQARITQGRLSAIVTTNIPEFRDPCKENVWAVPNGLLRMTYDAFPNHCIHPSRLTGMYFEHIFDGITEDDSRTNYTPHKERPRLTVDQSGTAATLTWPASESAWNLECLMTYTFRSPAIIDMEFKTKLGAIPMEQDWLGFMWASYIRTAVDRSLYFRGIQDDTEGLVRFGKVVSTCDPEDKARQNFETGTVKYNGVPPLPYETGVYWRKFVEDERTDFLEPWYFGFADGDGRVETSNDTFLYIMMFDQRASIRFAMWNWSGTTEEPAWDWQFIVRNPQAGAKYGYRARFMYVPLAGVASKAAAKTRAALVDAPPPEIADYVQRQYDAWTAGLPEPVRDAPPFFAAAMPPRIALRQGAKYPAPDIHAFDDFDGSLTHAIEWVPPDTSYPGKRTVAFRVTDSRGNAALWNQEVAVTRGWFGCRAAPPSCRE